MMNIPLFIALLLLVYDSFNNNFLTPLHLQSNLWIHSRISSSNDQIKFFHQKKMKMMWFCLCQLILLCLWNKNVKNSKFPNSNFFTFCVCVHFFSMEISFYFSFVAVVQNRSLRLFWWIFFSWVFFVFCYFCGLFEINKLIRFDTHTHTHIPVLNRINYLFILIKILCLCVYCVKL